MPPILAAHQLSKDYARGRETVHALRNVSFEIARSEFVAIAGPSGAGKTTLLHLLGCMDAPTSGHVEIEGSRVALESEKERTAIRRHKIGFIFQHFGLMPTLTVEENIALPGILAGGGDHADIQELLSRTGLESRRAHRPHQLSGGEMQRAAIARALYNKPKIVLADEPTGNLDARTGESILALLQELNGTGLTVVLVTHNENAAQLAGRRLNLLDGRLAD